MQAQTTPDTKLKVLAFTNNTASEWWRFNGIADRMNKNTEHRMMVAPYFAWDDDIAEANLVVLEQLSNPEIVKFCHERGVKVIFESDDAMIDSYSRERKNLMDLGPAFRGHAIETIAACDALTVTNKLLAENYARFTKKPIYVLPNYIDYNWYKPKDFIIGRTTDEIRIGWQGSKSHFEDLRMLVPVLDRILKKYPNVRFIYCGYGGMSSDKKATEIGWGEDVFKELTRSQREFVSATKPDYWPAKHATLDLDIGMCPLVDDYFNKCKTPIKWLEYGIEGTPAVVSDVLYGEYVKDGKDALVARTPEEWEKQLTYLIENVAARRKMGKEAKRRGDKDFNLDKHWYKWIATYQEVTFGIPLDNNLSGILRYQ